MSEGCWTEAQGLLFPGQQWSSAWIDDLQTAGGQRLSAQSVCARCRASLPCALPGDMSISRHDPSHLVGSGAGSEDPQMFLDIQPDLDRELEYSAKSNNKLGPRSDAYA